MNTPSQHILDLLDAEGLVTFVQRLVQTPSVFLPNVQGANEEAAAQLVFDLLDEWNLHPVREYVALGRPNVIAELQGALGDGPLLLFEGHTDVVTPGDRAQWTGDPFAGLIENGRLYGRGAADMKGGVGAMLFAVRALQLAGAPFRGRIRLLVPVDEEGLMLGVKHMVAQGHAEGAAGALICEPEEREVCLASKGALRLRLVSYGRIAHGAMPEEGVNALAAMVRLLARILDLEADLQRIHGVHPLLGKPYISPTVARAPLSGDTSQINCLPDVCDAYLDIRTVPAIVHGELVRQVRAIMADLCSAFPAYRFELEIIDDRPAVEIAADHPLVAAVVAGHEQVYGARPVWGGVPGSTDGTILARDAGVPVVVYGPGHKRIPHQPDEFVEVDEIVRAAQVYIVAAITFLGQEEPRS
ncbi:MAG TPA: M20 family metallopeptidase [Roseiflexaceae bacterium]|nr:M20 family metallopeptidase [Roseiflexaceae bacterium]